MRPQPLSAVTDVEASSNGELILQVHRLTVHHHHGPIADVHSKPNGNDALVNSATAMKGSMNVEPILPLHQNPPDGDGGPNHWEIWLRDPDSYKVVAASPYGTADGNWRPASKR